ncbi:hypothetical protein B0H65DRAFT_460643 [Neurospora tetraspora]|uniref:Uncharacterized protein n=1 Tax=Neurospora tetraspora TaxID=94610 RepID=A0AAE0JHU0_9PEZI|nr:hypothetical protein B0H65DRAFT_460643 [Neurospora tetraspora]
MDSSNPLSDREKAFENKYIHDKECVPSLHHTSSFEPIADKRVCRRQMAKDRANKKTQTESSSKDSSSTPREQEEGSGSTYKDVITELSAMPS